MSDCEPCVILVPSQADDEHSCHLCVRAQKVKCHNTLIKHFKLKHGTVDIVFKCRHCRGQVESIKKYPRHLRSCTRRPTYGKDNTPVPMPGSDTSDESTCSSLATVSNSPTHDDTRRPLVVPIDDFDMIPNRHLEHVISINPDDYIGNYAPSSPSNSSEQDLQGDSPSPVSTTEDVNTCESDCYSSTSNTPSHIPEPRVESVVMHAAESNNVTPTNHIPDDEIDLFLAELRGISSTVYNGMSQEHVSNYVPPSLNVSRGEASTRNQPLPEPYVGVSTTEGSQTLSEHRATCTIVRAQPVLPTRQNEAEHRNAEPELTPLQQELLAVMETVSSIDDMETLSSVAKKLIDAAAVKTMSVEGHERNRPSNRPDYPRRPPPRQQRYDPMDASALQKLYRKDRKKAISQIFQDMKPYCTIPRPDVQQHFQKLYSNPEHAWTPPPNCVPSLPIPEDEDSSRRLIAHVEPCEVFKRLNRMSNTAPGPDGIRYDGLKKVDPGCYILSALFSKCVALETSPAAWKESKTVLIHKAGDMNEIDNWRPLCLGNTIAKLYSGVLADRIAHWAVKNNLISHAQKGFLDFEGCLEHNFILQAAIEDARRRGNQLCVAWLDIANAFGAIPHAHIVGTLRAFGMPDALVNIVTNLYEGTTTQIMTSEGLTDPIPLLSGVKQGCPLSPILFNLAMEPMLRAVLELKNETGYKMLADGATGRRFNLLAYADDLVLVAKHEAALQLLIDTCVQAAEWSGLFFKPTKCATLHIDRRVRNTQLVLPTVYTIQETEVRALKSGEHYRHLGVPTGYRNRQTPEETVTEIIEKFQKLDDSLLAPWQKIDAAATFLMPKLDFIMRGAEVELKPINQADRVIKRLCKRWLNLPQRASPEVVYLAPSKGGAGLMPLRTSRYTMAIVQALRMLTCSDEFVRHVALNTLRAVVKTKLRRQINNMDLVNYLNGEGNGVGGNRSFWARVRRSTKELKKLFDLSWHWNEALEEIQLTHPKPSNNPAETSTCTALRQRVCRDLREATRHYFLKRLLQKPDQGKVFEISTQFSSSNHMIRNGAFTRFADWRFIHRARLDCVSLNATKRFSDGPQNCRRCPAAKETLPHVISCCHHHSLARHLRHNAIAARITKAIPQRLGTVRENQQVPGFTGERILRPDIVVINEEEKRLILCDVTVAFENRYAEFRRARQEKIDKYTPIVNHFRAAGWTTELDAIVVGALGSWDPANERTLRMLRIPRRYSRLMRKLIVSDTIRWSRDIYVEHLTGTRQYLVDRVRLPANPQAA